MMWVRAEQYHSTLLTDSSQEIQDIKDKLGDLIPWVIKLKGSLVNANTKADHEEVERRTQLAKFALCLCYLTTVN